MHRVTGALRPDLLSLIPFSQWGLLWLGEGYNKEGKKGSSCLLILQACVGLAHSLRAHTGCLWRAFPGT